MHIDICPAILARDPHTYRTQMERVAPFATRVHIDLSDGVLSPQKLLAIDHVWWPGGVRADLHVMYQRPFEHLELLVSLGPQMIIVHAEAEGDFGGFAKQLHAHGIEAGVALLQQTPVETILPALDVIDHVLIFSGNLGQFGGTADLGLLDKVQQLKQLKPQLEIGWDGGINDTNAPALVRGGVEVLNTGGFIQRASDPETAYAALQSAVLSDSIN